MNPEKYRRKRKKNNPDSLKITQPEKQEVFQIGNLSQMSQRTLFTLIPVFSRK